MLDVKEQGRRKRAEKAKNLRYKKAVAVGMNLEHIRSWVWEAFDSLEDVTYVSENDDMLVDAFDGDEEEAFEFRIAFNALASDLDAFRDDLDEAWIPDCFDDFFCACSGAGESFAGYDVVEQDYFGLSSYEAIAGQDEASKRLERLTKKDLVEAAQRCYQVAVAYLGLRSRFDDLRAAVDIIRAENDGLMSGVKAIEKLYDQWCQAKTISEKIAVDRRMEAIADQLPSEIWTR